MQKCRSLQFSCQSCQKPIQFSIFEMDNNEKIVCPDCNLLYDFNDDLKRQMKKFENLCRQIQLSEEILSDTCIAIYLGEREVKIPYKLLLTRLNSTLDLRMGDRPLSICFRIEPTIDTPSLEKYREIV